MYFLHNVCNVSQHGCYLDCCNYLCIDHITKLKPVLDVNNQIYSLNVKMQFVEMVERREKSSVSLFLFRSDF